MKVKISPRSAFIVNMLFIKRHNRMMMELLSRCYVNQEARQAPNCETGKVFGKRKMHNLFEKRILLLPPGVVNRQGISWEWPPRIGARKKQNLSEQRMNRILSYELSISNWTLLLFVETKFGNHSQLYFLQPIKDVSTLTFWWFSFKGNEPLISRNQKEFISVIDLWIKWRWIFSTWYWTH